MLKLKQAWNWLEKKTLQYAWVILPPAVAATILTGIFGTEPDPRTPGENDLESWAIAPFVVSLMATLLSAAAVSERGKQRRFAAGDRSERIARLNESLNDALDAIEGIRTEIEQGDRALLDLERRRDVATHLAGLSEREAAAVRNALRDEFGRERRRSLARDVSLMILGAILGAIAARLIG